MADGPYVERRLQPARMRSLLAETALPVRVETRYFLAETAQRTAVRPLYRAVRALLATGEWLT